MTTRLFMSGRRAVLVQAVTACCLLWLTGCEGGWGGKSIVPKMKNPFASSSKATADKQAKKPAKVGPDFAQDLTRGREMERAGRLAEARDVYQKLIVKYPDRYEPYHRLGVVADRQKRYREAQALYAQAISIVPDPEVFNDLGYCLYLQGKLEKAEVAMLKAVSMMPANARFRNNLGMIYGHQGRFDEAMEQFRRGGSEADAFYNMAFILAGRDDVDGAKDCFRLALAADPNHQKARDALRRFEQSLQSEDQIAGTSRIMPDGRRWERYVEPGQARTPQPQAGPAQAASYNAPVAPKQASRPERVVPSTRRDTQALLRRAREMMTQRMAQPDTAQ